MPLADEIAVGNGNIAINCDFIFAAKEREERSELIVPETRDRVQLHNIGQITRKVRERCVLNLEDFPAKKKCK